MANLGISGFVVDAPNVLVKSKNGDYQNVTASTGEVTFGGDTLKINGGQSFYELAELDKSKTIALKATDAQFNIKSMAVSSGGSLSKGTAPYEFFGELFTVDGTGTFIIPKAIIAGSLRINDYTEIATGTPAEGQFRVTISSSTTTVQLPLSDADTNVSPSYQVNVDNITTLSTKTTDFPKSGEVTLEWPLYAGSEADEQEVVGYAQIVIYKAKILQSFKVGGNYKTASTFDFSANGLDPKRPDKKMWDLRFRPIDNSSSIPTGLSVSSITPADKATAVADNSTINFVFSSNIDASTINSANIIIMDSSSGASVAGTFAIGADKTDIIFTPSTTLTAATKYIVTVTTNVKDIYGNSLSSNEITTFTTA